MVAYRRIAEPEETPEPQQVAPKQRRAAGGFRAKKALSHDLFHDHTPEEFDREATSLADAEALTPEARTRLEMRLVERLKTPVDKPSWGPDWVRHGDKHAPKRRKPQGSGLLGLLSRNARKEEDEDEEVTKQALSPEKEDDAHIIARNIEKSRQVHHYRWLYGAAVVLALVIAGAAMFVDYHIIREVWTRALSNEFMQVPASLQGSVIFKSLQVVFAVLIVHFFLKITGAYGRNTMIVATFILALLMIGSLGYLTAYNNMAGATSAQQERSGQDATQADSSNAIDNLFNDGASRPAAEKPQVYNASMTEGVSLPLPKLSQKSLADADNFLWLVFASVVFFIVTVVAALYIQSVESNVRNVAITRDYAHRRRQFAQLHLLELADKRQSAKAG